MNQDKYVFAQLVTFLDRNHFNYLARKYDGDRYVKHFTCWNQLLALMFGQFSNREQDSVNKANEKANTNSLTILNGIKENCYS